MEQTQDAHIHPANRLVDSGPDGILPMSLRNHGFDGQPDPTDPYATPQLRHSTNPGPSDQSMSNYHTSLQQEDKDSPFSSPNRLQTFAARSKARPDLSLDTSRSLASNSKTPASTTNDDDTSPTVLVNIPETRRASVPGRSPLQTLETKLGDISKEEKRARLEEAEALARKRANSRGETLESLSGSGAARQASVKQPGVSNSRDERIGTRNVSDGNVEIMHGNRKDHTRYPSSSSYRSSRGHDPLLTGGAAAAAVSAYQAGLRTGTHHSALGESASNPQRQLSSQPESPPSKHSNTSSTQMHQNFRDGPAAAVQGFKSTQAMSSAKQAEPEGTIKQQAQDPVTKGRGNLRFSDIVFQNKQSTRRYQEPDYLEEFRDAQTARLLKSDLDINSNKLQPAWWEKGADQTKSVSGVKDQTNPDRSTRKPILTTTGGDFSPALTLKCGPLLRYRGMGGNLEQEFWRGSVMIVTEDKSSLYQDAPMLRLFRQQGVDDNGLPNTTAANETLTAEAVTLQPIELLKMSKTGSPLYLRPIDQIMGERDLSREQTNGLFETRQTQPEDPFIDAGMKIRDGEQLQQYVEVKGARLHVERGHTFWRFNIEVELDAEEMRIAYRINNGPALGFWVPPRGQPMNIMFHSCNGFSLSVDPNSFSGPDPLWRDVLVSHQQCPFHCMVGGGDQIYNDAAMNETTLFQKWLAIMNPEHKHAAHFTVEMQDELEQFYFDRYAMWFSQGLFSVANSQIPMVNIWDDHDIIDGYGSYPHHFMNTSVFTGLGAVAFKYYMLFQHQSNPEELERDEASWILGASRGPYINQLSRSLFMYMGRPIAFLGIDCRTERMRDEVLSEDTYDIILDRCRDEIVEGQTKHLIVLLGIPIAYPRLNILENVLTSRIMDPIKALGRTGLLRGFLNRFDGGIEILDDLDDHWTAKHHKHERNWFIRELQELAAEKSVRITILGGDVHLAACGQFYSNPKLGIPKDQDHRYIPNVISSAIVNTPPPEMLSDVLNKKNKVHHLDKETDESMIPLFTHDVDGTVRNNHHLLPRRNWCSIREYIPSNTPPASIAPEQEVSKPRRSFSLRRSLSRNRGEEREPGFLRRFSTRKAPPSSFRAPVAAREGSPDELHGNNLDHEGAGNGVERTYSFEDGQNGQGLGLIQAQSGDDAEERGRPLIPRSRSFARRPSSLSRKLSKSDPTGRGGHIDLQGGLDISIHCEIDQKDPSGRTVPYRLLVPALNYQGRVGVSKSRLQSKVSNLIGSLSRKSDASPGELKQVPYENTAKLRTPPLGERAYGRPMTDEHRSNVTNGQQNSGGDGETEKQFVATPQDNGLLKDELPRGPQTVVTPGTQQGSSEVFVTPHMSQGPLNSNTQPSIDSQSKEGTSVGSLREIATPVAKETEATNSVPTTTAHTIQSQIPPSQGGPGIRGPPPPRNIEDLPLSVQKRYSQFEPFGEAPLLPASIDQLRIGRKHAIQPGAEVHRSVSGPTRAYATTTYPARAATLHNPPSNSLNPARNDAAPQAKLSPLGSAPVDFIPSHPSFGSTQSYQTAKQTPPRKTHYESHDPYMAYLDSPSDSQVSGEHPPRRRTGKLDRFFGGVMDDNHNHGDFHGRYYSNGEDHAAGVYDSDGNYEGSPKTGRFGRLMRRLSEGNKGHKQSVKGSGARWR